MSTMRLTPSTHNDAHGASEGDARTGERRLHRRVPLKRPCKVYHRDMDRYLPALSANVSECGALLWLEGCRPFAVGDTLDVAIGWSGVALIAEDAMTPARVVRVTGSDQTRQAIAVVYEPSNADAGGIRSAA